MSLTWLSVPRGEMGMNPIRRVTRVGLRMLSTTGIGLLVLLGCRCDSSDVGRGEVVIADYPSVDASFLSALEWRFVGPYRGGRVVAVAGHPDDPLIYYFGAAHGGVWKTTDAGRNWRNVSDGFFKLIFDSSIDILKSCSHIINSLRLKKPIIAVNVVPK